MRILVLVITTLMLMTSYQNCAPGASDQAINGAGNPSILGMGTNGVGPMGTDTGTGGGEDILPEYFSVAKTLCSKLSECTAYNQQYCIDSLSWSANLINRMVSDNTHYSSFADAIEDYENNQLRSNGGTLLSCSQKLVESCAPYEDFAGENTIGDYAAEDFSELLPEGNGCNEIYTRIHNN